MVQMLDIIKTQPLKVTSNTTGMLKSKMADEYYSENEVPQFAFSDPAGNVGKATLTEVRLSDDVTSIGNSAFYWCSNMSYFSVPSSLTSIDYGAFRGCYSLSSFEIL